jgi:DNA polymerase
MEGRAEPELAEQIAAALAWWQDAGVGWDFSDEPTDWLKQAPPPVAQAPAARQPVPATETSAVPPLGSADESWPQDLASFTPWWLNEPSLDGGMVRDRVPPRGTAGAEIMVIVAEPERDDTDRLLSGPQGRLLSGLLAALGLAEDQAYFAAALPRHTPHPDWRVLAEGGLGKILRHHVGLARPKTVLAFGGNILSLLGHDPAQRAAELAISQDNGGTVPLFAGPDLATLLARPKSKGPLWQRLLDWRGREIA